jgi:hypothetical protein
MGFGKGYADSFIRSRALKNQENESSFRMTMARQQMRDQARQFDERMRLQREQMKMREEVDKRNFNRRVFEADRGFQAQQDYRVEIGQDRDRAFEEGQKQFEKRHALQKEGMDWQKEKFEESARLREEERQDKIAERRFQESQKQNAMRFQDAVKGNMTSAMMNPSHTMSEEDKNLIVGQYNLKLGGDWQDVEIIGGQGQKAMVLTKIDENGQRVEKYIDMAGQQAGKPRGAGRAGDPLARGKSMDKTIAGRPTIKGSEISALKKSLQTEMNEKLPKDMLGRQTGKLGELNTGYKGFLNKVVDNIANRYDMDTGAMESLKSQVLSVIETVPTLDELKKANATDGKITAGELEEKIVSQIVDSMNKTGAVLRDRFEQAPKPEFQTSGTTGSDRLRLQGWMEKIEAAVDAGEHEAVSSGFTKSLNNKFMDPSVSNMKQLGDIERWLMAKTNNGKSGESVYREALADMRLRKNDSSYIRMDKSDFDREFMNPSYGKSMSPAESKKLTSDYLKKQKMMFKEGNQESNTEEYVNFLKDSLKKVQKTRDDIFSGSDDPGYVSGRDADEAREKRGIAEALSEELSKVAGEVSKDASISKAKQSLAIAYINDKELLEESGVSMSNMRKNAVNYAENRMVEIMTEHANLGTRGMLEAGANGANKDLVEFKQLYDWWRKSSLGDRGTIYSTFSGLERRAMGGAGVTKMKGRAGREDFGIRNDRGIITEVDEAFEGVTDDIAGGAKVIGRNLKDLFSSRSASEARKRITGR